MSAVGGVAGVSSDDGADGDLAATAWGVGSVGVGHEFERGYAENVVGYESVG